MSILKGNEPQTLLQESPKHQLNGLVNVFHHSIFVYLTELAEVYSNPMLCYVTLPKNDLLSHLNWGAQVLMEISSNV